VVFGFFIDDDAMRERHFLPLFIGEIDWRVDKFPL